MRGACDIFAAMGDRGYRSSAAALLADVLHAQGKDDEAERFTEVSEQLASSDDIDAQTLWRAVRGKVLAGRGRTAAALTLAREAVALAQTTDSYELHADALSDLAAVLRLGGQPREAADVLRAALDRYERKGARIMVDRTRELLNDVDKELSLSPR